MTSGCLSAYSIWDASSLAAGPVGCCPGSAPQEAADRPVATYSGGTRRQ